MVVTVTIVVTVFDNVPMIAAIFHGFFVFLLVVLLQELWFDFQTGDGLLRGRLFGLNGSRPITSLIVLDAGNRILFKDKLLLLVGPFFLPLFGLCRVWFNLFLLFHLRKNVPST